MAPEACAADAGLYGDVATRGSRVWAGFVRPAHQVECFFAADLRRIEVECGGETEASTNDHTDANARGDFRARQVELPPGSDAQQRRLETGGVARGEELLGVGPRPARAAHLARHVEADVKATVARAGMTVTTAGSGCLGGVEDLGLVAHRCVLLSIDTKRAAPRAVGAARALHVISER
jgi:hypothetical protein